MKIRLLTFLVLCFTSQFLYAGIISSPMPIVTPGTSTPGVTSSNTDTQNRAYAGLIWTLKDRTSWIPDLTFGFRSLRVKSSDSVNGGDISARIKLSNGIAVDSVALSYVGGKRELLGNVGAGYSFTNTSILGTVGLQGAYTRIGTDFQFANKQFIPYLELLTIDKPSNVRKTTTPGTLGPNTLSCPQPFTLMGTTCILAPPL